jgi:hypothetical protein
VLDDLFQFGKQRRGRAHAKNPAETAGNSRVSRI